MPELDRDQLRFFDRVDVVDPVITDDENSDFRNGALWFNSVSLEVFRLVRKTAGAALWKPSVVAPGGGAPSAINPGELMLGTLLDYPFSAGTAKGEVTYIRIRISAGVAIASMRVFLDSGGTAARNIRLGLYSQTDLSDASLPPSARVAQTAQVNLNGLDGSFITEALLGGNFLVPTTGFYWLALVVDNTSAKFAVSATHRANFLNVRHEIPGITADFPASAGVTINPISAVPYLAAVEA